MVDSPLPPTEAAKLIKFYLNLYPDLVGTLKEYFPKQASSEFNRIIKVSIPKDIKSEFAVKLTTELAYISQNKEFSDEDDNLKVEMLYSTAVL